MVIRFSRRAAFLIVLNLFLFAQIAFGQKLYAQEKNHRFSQKLEWKADVKAFEYKVEIRNLENKKITSFTTEETEISFSFPAGDYEWRVIAYDYLGRESTRTGWSPFTIKKAFEPDVRALKDEVVFETGNAIIIPVQTERVQPGAVVELLDSNTGNKIRGKIADSTAVFENVPEGNYRVKITNPGGLSSETSSVKLIEKDLHEEELRLAEQQRLEEEKRLAEEEKRLAEEERLKEELLEKERLEEEKRLAEEERLKEKERLEEEKRLAEEEKQKEKEQQAEEKRIAKEEKQAKRAKSTAMTSLTLGAYYPFPIMNGDILLDKKTNFGGSIKFEHLPVPIGKTRFGFNIETDPLPVINNTSYADELLLFMPFTFNLSYAFPIFRETIYGKIQAGGGLVIAMHSQTFKPEYDGYTRGNIMSFYVNYMYDAGVGVRFILGKHFVTDVTVKFSNWRVGGYDIMNINAGVQIGWKF